MSEIDVPETSMEVKWESDWSHGLVPKQIASVSVWFRTRPLWMNQLWREEIDWLIDWLIDWMIDWLIDYNNTIYWLWQLKAGLKHLKNYTI